MTDTSSRLSRAVWPLAESIAALAVAALLARAFDAWLSTADTAMLFLVPVLWMSVRHGLAAALAMAVAAALACNFLFFRPALAFGFETPTDFVTFFVFLLTAAVSGRWVGKATEQTGVIRKQAEDARRREADMALLYGLSRNIVAEVDPDRLAALLREALSAALGVEAGVLRCRDGGFIDEGGAAVALAPAEADAAAAALAEGLPSGCGTPRSPAARRCYVPLSGETGAIGILALEFGADWRLDAERQAFLAALGDLAVVAFERARLAAEMDAARSAVETERLRSALLSSISHDFRTPLAAILGAATTLQDEGARFDEPARRELLATIAESAEVLNRYLANLLEMIRLEAGGVRPRLDWVEIGEPVATAVRRIEPRLAGRALYLSIEPDLPLLRLDFMMMEQVLHNLLDNALKYGAPGTPITVRAALQDDAVVVSVTSQGPVVPLAEGERIFDKFYRLPSAAGVPGTGLGLAICRQFVEAQGGRINAAANETGSGMTFTLRLPAPDVRLDKAALDG